MKHTSHLDIGCNSNPRNPFNASKIFKTLGWSPDENFKTGILKTVEWYLNNKEWWGKLQGDRNKETVN